MNNMSDQQPILEVKNVSKSFGGIRALKSGSFKLSRGEVIAVVGGNGAGKSTLIKIVAGVHQPDTGSVIIKGKPVDIQHHNVGYMRQLGVEVVYQDLAIVPNMTAPYNLFLGRIPCKFGLFIDKKTMIKKTREVLKELNITTVQSLSGPISDMSGGQQQSIAIGRAIAWGKEIVILDEPTAALGPNETQEVERVVREIKERGTAVILISHNLEQVFRLADRIVVVYHGVTSREFQKTEVTIDQLVKAITQGAASVASAEEIWVAAQRVFSQHPDIKILAGSWDRMTRENGIKYTKQYITRFQPGEIDAIIVLGAVAGLGSQFAVEQAGRDDIAVITTDIDEQVAQCIREGKLGFSIGGHWMVGGFGLIQLYDYLHGFPVKNPQPLFNLIPVTKDNVDIYEHGLLQSCVLSPEQIRNLSRVYNPDADLPGFVDQFSKNWEKYAAAGETEESPPQEGGKSTPQITPRQDLVIADLGQPETNPWVSNRRRFERCVAEALGITLIEADDENSEEEHVNQAESLIARKPDGLVFNPLTSPAGIQVARLLEDNQIPGVAVGRLVVNDYNKEYSGKYFIAQVTQNNKTWGESIAQAVIKAGHKKVAVIWNQ